MPFIWRTANLTLTFCLDDGPVRLESVHWDPEASAGPVEQPLVEVSALGHGHSVSSHRHVGTALGQRLRYTSHEATDTNLRIVQQDAVTGLEITSFFEATNGVRAWTEARLTGRGSLELTSLSSVVVAIDSVDFELISGDNNWMAESRWSSRPLREIALPDIQRPPHHPPPRTAHAVTSRGSWSTGEHLPTGVLLRDGYALGWQIEHNGPWYYEIGENQRGGYLLLGGPSDQEHQWTATITADRPFTTVPVSLVAASDRDGAFAALTRQRRAIRRHRPAEDKLPVIFNDYMNTLMGDPTTKRLLPLIDAAAAVGAEYFCIDAGWYADGNWWSTVGAWRPSTTRFPAGLGEVIDRIHNKGMVPGLWLEPEVVGVDSPLAKDLPDDAFLSRRGIRVAENGRHLLDLRSPAARRHLDDTVDRLVTEYGIGFFKLDNNTMTGPGTDSDGQSLGQGLLEHQRALLDWLDDVQARHPKLLLENCGSGALRMDYAMLSRMHLQSTSDQQDPLLYATIAAAAPASVLPEQAGNWAYPQTGMSREEFTLCLVNGVLGRMYLSGHLDRMTQPELDLVRSALAAHRAVLTHLPQLVPFWPLGLPTWTDEWVALGLEGPSTSYLTVWHRSAQPSRIDLPLPRCEVKNFFPAQSDGWTYDWKDNTLTITANAAEPSARVLELG